MNNSNNKKLPSDERGENKRGLMIVNKNLRATHKVRDCLHETVKQAQTELKILHLM
jgi:hypothetical protein